MEEFGVESTPDPTNPWCDGCGGRPTRSVWMRSIWRFIHSATPHPGYFCNECLQELMETAHQNHRPIRFIPTALTFFLK